MAPPTSVCCDTRLRGHTPDSSAATCALRSPSARSMRERVAFVGMRGCPLHALCAPAHELVHSVGASNDRSAACTARARIHGLVVTLLHMVEAFASGGRGDGRGPTASISASAASGMAVNKGIDALRKRASASIHASFPALKLKGARRALPEGGEMERDPP